MMSNSGFEKIQHSHKTLFGPRKLLLCGFEVESQKKFKILLKMIGIKALPLVWVTDQQSTETLKALVELPNGNGTGQTSNLPRAIIISGITENELHQLMSGCRKAGMKQALWATLTPTSNHWELQKLLSELIVERNALTARHQTKDD